MPPTRTTKRNAKAADAPSGESSTADKPLPLFFYGAKSKPYGVFSQWYLTEFTVYSASLEYLRKGKTPSFTLPEMVKFTCTEQYMMYCKAVYFDDKDIAEEILENPGPKEQKALGRRVSNFVEEDWVKIREKIVEEGNFAKFSQDRKCKEILLGTEERELCEASPRDRIWGIGFGETHAAKMLEKRHIWGSNLLGKALVKARTRIRANE